MEGHSYRTYAECFWMVHVVIVGPKGLHKMQKPWPQHVRQSIGNQENGQSHPTTSLSNDLIIDFITFK